MCCGPNQRIPYLFSFVLAKCFTQNFIHHPLGRLKKGGKFIFIDLFQDPKYYPDPSKIDIAIESRNGMITERVRLDKIIELPFPLKHKKVLGYAEIITGRIVDKDSR